MRVKLRVNYVAILNCHSRPLLDQCTSLSFLLAFVALVYHKPEICLYRSAKVIILLQNHLLLCTVCYWLELELNRVPMLCSGKSLWCFSVKHVSLCVSYISETKTLWSIFQCGEAQLHPGETWSECSMANSKTKVLMFEWCTKFSR